MTPTKIHLTFRQDASGDVLIDKASPEPFVGSEEYHLLVEQKPMHKAPTTLIEAGHAYGMYWCSCRDCGQRFEGAKRSFRCKPCASALISSPSEKGVG